MIQRGALTQYVLARWFNVCASCISVAVVWVWCVECRVASHPPALLCPSLPPRHDQPEEKEEERGAEVEGGGHNEQGVLDPTAAAVESRHPVQERWHLFSSVRERGGGGVGERERGGGGVGEG